MVSTIFKDVSCFFDLQASVELNYDWFKKGDNSPLQNILRLKDLNLRFYLRGTSTKSFRSTYICW